MTEQGATILSAKDAAKRAGVTKRAVYEWINDGFLPAKRNGRGMWEIAGNDIDKFMSSRELPSYSQTYLLSVDGYSLTQLRIEANLSMEKLAAYFPGCNKSTISRWEQEEMIPSYERMWKLVEIFGTTEFIRLNGKAVVTEAEQAKLQTIRPDAVIGRLNPKAALTVFEADRLRKLFPNRDLVVLRLNNEVVLTAEEIEAVKKLREG